ncbi:MAG: signal recognition particle-docking protein FtsY [Nitrososphaerota archaeon]|nr:signal recognition particle-docking protein FtsY [Candidatus Calditenuaceae archaeon]MDW8072856.1 signal recognition particle-docking protein FtsY [Nitrososphaerota archaeon]
MLEGLKRAFQSLTERVTKATLSEKELREALEDFKLQLVGSDVSLETAEHIVNLIRPKLAEFKVPRFGEAEDAIKTVYRDVLNNILLEFPPETLLSNIEEKSRERGEPYIILFVGPNGGGKTTTIAKIAYWLKKNGLASVLACADTFRAAAIEQAKNLAAQVGVRAVSQKYGADPAAVAMDTIISAKSNRESVVLIDTAGRSEAKKNLLDEMRKMKRVAQPDSTILVLDSLTGSAAREQARRFHENVGVDYVVLTKLDSDSRGGLALTVCHEIRSPIVFIGVGQGMDDLKPFKKEFIVERILA